MAEWENNSAVLQRPANTQDASMGNVKEPYTTIYTFPCNVQNGKNNDEVLFMQRVCKVEKIFMTTKIMTFIPGDIILYNGLRYYIAGKVNYGEMGLAYKYITVAYEGNVI